MNLLDHWIVGFSGSRHLEKPEIVRTAVREALQRAQNLADGRLIAISSVAIGADRLFVDEATQAGIPWICILPFPEDEFFNEKDFPDAAERQAARRKAAEAADREVVRFPRNSDEAKDSNWRRAAFAEAGFREVEQADIFIAAYPETTEPVKTGGARDIAAYARARNRPLLIVDPQNGKLRSENWPLRLVDPLTEELSGLEIGDMNTRERLELPTPAAITLAMWRSGFAQAARRHVPGIRWGNSAVVILHALATIITATVFLLLYPVNIHLPGGASESGTWLLKALEVSAFVFVLIGFGFLVWMLWKRPQVHAANYRFAAEIGRSILATWCIPGVANEIVRGLPLEFMHFARNLVLQRRLDPDRLPGTSDGNFSKEEIDKLAINYVEHRITPQVAYYSGKYLRSKRAARTLEIGSIVFSLVALVSAGLLAFSHTPELYRALLGLAKLAAATAAPVTVSMLVIHEVKRREARYHEMERSARQYEQRIRQVRSIVALQELVADVERMFLAETNEWWVLAKGNVAA